MRYFRFQRISERENMGYTNWGTVSGLETMAGGEHAAVDVARQLMEVITGGSDTLCNLMLHINSLWREIRS